MSISVTRTPSAANMLAYSHPITPAPITASVRGSSSSCIMSSLEKMQVSIERRPLVARRMGPNRQHNRCGGNSSLHSARFIFEVEHVRIDKARARRGQLNTVAQKLMPQHVDLMAHNRIDPDQQILERDFFLDPVRIAIHRVLAITRQIHDRFAHRLAGNRSDVDTDAADQRFALDHDDAFAQLGALDGRMMSGGPGADDREIKIKLRHRAQLSRFAKLDVRINLPKAIRVQPLLEFFEELFLHDARNMTGSLNFDYLPIAAHALQRHHVQLFHRVAIADEDFDRDAD